MNCLSCENYIPLDPPIQRTDAQGQTYTVPGLLQNWCRPHNLWTSGLPSDSKM